MTSFAKLEKIVRERTPGPWRCFDGDESDYGPIVQAGYDGSVMPEPRLHIVSDDIEHDWPVRMNSHDASFIAAMGTLADKLLDLVKAAEAVCRPDAYHIHALEGVEDALAALRQAQEELP